MAKSYTDLYNEDPIAGDALTGNEILAYDPDPNTGPTNTKGMTIDQFTTFVGSTIVSTPGTVGFKLDSYTVDEGGSVSIVLDRTDYKSYPSINGSCDISVSGVSENAQYSMFIDGVYLPNNSTINFSTEDLSKTITFYSIPGSISADTPVSLLLTNFVNIVAGNVDASLTIINDNLPVGEQKFSMTVPENSLTASIAPVLGISYIAYQIVVDNSTPITDIGDSNFIYTAVPSTYLIADWDTHEYYLYVHNGVTVTQILPSTADDNGSGGITIQANDTSTTGLTKGHTWIEYETEDSLAAMMVPGYFESVGLTDSTIRAHVISEAGATVAYYTFKVIEVSPVVVVELVPDGAIATSDHLRIGFI